MKEPGKNGNQTKVAALLAPRRYSRLVIGATLLVLLTVLVINMLVDPLWYFSGNQFTKKNAYFNERDAKVNFYYKRRSEYDCILFGASSGTTLDVTDIDKFRCFNFAFSIETSLRNFRTKLLVTTCHLTMTKVVEDQIFMELFYERTRENETIQNVCRCRARHNDEHCCICNIPQGNCESAANPNRARRVYHERESHV